MPMLATTGGGSARRSGFMGDVSFRFTLVNGANLNLRTQAVSAGWNGLTAVIATLTGNAFSNTTSAVAMTVAGSFPRGVTLKINSGGRILGATGSTGSAGFSYSPEALGYGGAGGAGGPPLPNNQGYYTPSSGGSPGSAGNHAYYDFAGITYVIQNSVGGGGGTGGQGGIALLTDVPLKIINNGNINGGAGGPGGGGGQGRVGYASGGGGGGGGGGYLTGFYNQFGPNQAYRDEGTTGGVGGQGAGLNGDYSAGGYSSGFGRGGLGVAGGYGGGLLSQGQAGAPGYNEMIGQGGSFSVMSPGGAGGVADNTALYGSVAGSGATGAPGIGIFGIGFITFIVQGTVTGAS